MKKLVRIAAVIAGGLLVVAAIGVLAAAWLFDPNDYKSALAAEIEQRTGRTLAIERELELRYVPWLAVEAGGVVVGNAEGFSRREFARIDQLAARIELLPLLLERRVRIGTIVLEGLDLNLEVDAEGRGNWLIRNGPRRPRADADSGADAPTAPGWLATLDVDGVRIRDASVTWRDLATDDMWSVTELTVTTGAYDPGRPVDVEAAFRFVEASAGIDAVLDAAATVNYAPGSGIALRDGRAAFELTLSDRGTAEGLWRFDAIEWPANRALTVTASQLSASIEAPALGTRRHDVELAAPRIAIDGAAGRVGVDTLTTSIDGLAARWQLTASALTTPDARLDGRVAIESAALATTLDALGIAPPTSVDRSALGAFGAAADFAVRLKPLALELTRTEARALGARISGSGTWRPTDGTARASFDVPRFEPNAELQAVLAAYLPERIALDAFERAAVTAAVELDTRAGTLAVRDVRAELLGGTLTGRIDIESQANALNARGRLATPGIATHALERAFGALVTDTLDAHEPGTLAIDTQFSYDGAARRLDLGPLALEAYGLDATGHLTATELSTSPVLTGRARIAEFPPRDVMRRFGLTPPATSDPSALARASLETRFAISAERGDFRELVLELDDSRITGELSVTDFDDPAYGFALAVDRLDADRYLAPPAETAGAGEDAAGDLELNGDALDVLRLDGRVRVGALELAGLEFEQVATRVTLGRGRLMLEDAEAVLYGGRFDGAFSVDAGLETPRMSLDGRAQRIDVAPLLTALRGSAQLSGTGDFDLALAGSGVTVTENVRSATGTLEFALRDGAIEGFDLGHALCKTYNATQRLPQPPAADTPRTRFELLGGTAVVARGVATSDDLLARTAFMDVTGRGSLDLAERGLDYTLDAKLTAPIGIPRCESMTALVGDSIPLTLRGTPTAPEIRPDFGEILKRGLEDALRNRATEGLEERVRERLRDLF